MISELDEWKIEMKNGLTLEEMKALYYDENAIRAQPRIVYRVGGTSKRVYYTLDEAGEPFFYSSVTTAIARNMPTSPHLIKWIAEMGIEEAEAYKEERADYGTFLHIEISTLLIWRKLDLDSLEDRLLAYMEEKRLPAGFIYHAEELRKDVLAFAQFVIDYKVRPLAVEIILADEEMGMAGAIDMPCEMTITEKGFFGEVYKSGVNKGLAKETKRETVIRAIVDFKSGRKGFYDTHEAQLEIYRKIWNKNFPDLEVDKLYNWAPNEWRGATPTYKLKDQTGSAGTEQADLIVQMERLKRKREKRGLLVTQGEINLDSADLSENYYSIEMGEFVKEKHNDRK
jgi:hypothetical protein